MLLMKWQNLNTKARGYYRDREVIEYIRLFEVLSIEQISVLSFMSIRNREYRLNKVRARMKVLCDNEKVGCVKIRSMNGYTSCYFCDIKNNNPIHDINRNWGLIWLMKEYQEKYKLSEIKFEYVIGNLQADGFIEMSRYINDNDKVFYFIESDRVGSKNKFDKVKKYNNLYVSNKYCSENWVKYSKHFPWVLIVSDSDRKKDMIKRIVRDENINGLKFRVMTIDWIKDKLLNY